MIELSIDPRAAGADPLPPPRESAGRLRWRLIWLYILGSAAAVVVTFALVLIGLEFTTRQWLLLFALAAIVVPIYVAPDIYVIGRHYRPIGEALRALGEGRAPTSRQASEAIVRALNLPFYSFVRVSSRFPLAPLRFHPALAAQRCDT
jgi:adenylate cyclase